MALDFVSFLLSKGSVAAQSTMSPLLKQVVPIGSLEGRLVEHVPSMKEKEKIAQAAKGWKIDSFKSVAAKIDNAAVKLEQEVSHEVRYWEQLSRLKAEGWPLSRLPNNRRRVGVHFGSAEAARTFRSRGFAPLNSAEDGNLAIDSGGISQMPVAVQVTISRNDRQYTCSRIPMLSLNDDESIEQQVLRARNTLYEEELFYELGREGRFLANQGVHVSGKTVEMEVDNKYHLCFELVVLKRDKGSFIEGPDQEFVESIALALRLLLRHAHRQTLERRSRPPAPMSLKPRPMPEYVLLRPIMTHLQHRSLIESMQSFFSAFVAPLAKAGLEARYQIATKIDDDLTSISTAATISAGSLTGAFAAPIESTVELTLPTARVLKLKIRTYLGQPTLGTEYNIPPISYTFTTLTAPRLSTIKDVEDFVCHATVVDLTSWIETREQEDPKWKTTEPRLGELARRGSHAAEDILVVNVWRDKFGLRHLQGDSSKSDRLSACIWESDKYWTATASGRHASEIRQISEVLLQLNSGDGRL